MLSAAECAEKQQLPEDGVQWRRAAALAIHLAHAASWPPSPDAWLCDYDLDRLAAQFDADLSDGWAADPTAYYPSDAPDRLALEWLSDRLASSAFDPCDNGHASIRRVEALLS